MKAPILCVWTVSFYFGLRSCTLEFDSKYLLALLTWLLSHGVVPGRARKVIIVDVFLRPFFSKATESKVWRSRRVLIFISSLQNGEKFIPRASIPIMWAADWFCVAPNRLYEGIWARMWTDPWTGKQGTARSSTVFQASSGRICNFDRCQVGKFFHPGHSAFSCFPARIGGTNNEVFHMPPSCIFAKKFGRSHCICWDCHWKTRTRRDFIWNSGFVGPSEAELVVIGDFCATCLPPPNFTWFWWGKLLGPGHFCDLTSPFTVL